MPGKSGRSVKLFFLIPPWIVQAGVASGGEIPGLAADSESYGQTLFVLLALNRSWAPGKANAYSYIVGVF